MYTYIRGIKLSKKRNNKMNMPDESEIKEAKETLKNMIDEMPTLEFIQFSFIIMQMLDILENDIEEDFYDEMVDDEELPF